MILVPSFVIYAISAVGETNRAPFDLPEAESELVGGFHTEYTSLKFALFFLAEYVNMVTVSALATTLFLGGWRAPFGIGTLWEGANTGWWPVLWFIGKVAAALFVFIWLRGTLPRLRYDQFMRVRLEDPRPDQPGSGSCSSRPPAPSSAEYDLGNRQLLGAVGAALAAVLAAEPVPAGEEEGTEGGRVRAGSRGWLPAATRSTWWYRRHRGSSSPVARSPAVTVSTGSTVGKE